MNASINDKVIDRLIREYNFKQSGEWLRSGVCDDCKKKSLYTHAHNPRIVKCGRINKCGGEWHVKELFEDLFNDWSKNFKQTEENPNAAADAYLRDGRKFSIKKLKGSYSQGQFYARKLNAETATVRFPLPHDGNMQGYWERFIDRPDRFERKANMPYGYKVNGYMWFHPDYDAAADELWIAEGIFDACALAEAGKNTASCISCTNFPTFALEDIKKQAKQADKDLPLLVWAFDSDSAGRSGTLNAIKKASDMGFECIAVQPPSGKRKLDWSDLHEQGKLTEDDFINYRHYGELLTAKSANDTAYLMWTHRKSRSNSFYFNFDHRIWWFELDTAKLSKETDLTDEQIEEIFKDADDEAEFIKQAFIKHCTVKEICNCTLNALYFQRNSVTDESWYYFRLATKKGSIQTTVTGDQISSPSKFKPRLLSVIPGVFWTGSANQLDLIMRHQTEGLREVRTVDFIGYSKENSAYVFNDVAFSKGRAISINDQDFFKVGNVDIKSLASHPELHINHKQKPNFNWWNKFYIVRGSYGVIALAWWFGSYFAEQIRGISRSYPFIEIIGQAGAGKSRMLEFFWRLSGRDDHEGFDPSKASKVAVYREFAQVANLPIALIEGDRNDEDGKKSFQRFEWDSLKDAFNGRPIRSRGVKNSGNDTYSPPFRAALAISQNETIQASEAMLTRIIHMELTREGQTLETKRLVDELDRISVDEASRFMATALKAENDILKTYTEKVSEYEDRLHAADITHTRIALNHAQIMALIDALHQHVLCDVMSDAQVKAAQKLLFGMAQQRIERLSADHPQVIEFWSVYEYLENMGGVAVNHHGKGKPTVAININQFYKYASEERQQLPDITTIKRLLATSKRYKFLETNRTVNSANLNKTVKCWIFEKP